MLFERLCELPECFRLIGYSVGIIKERRCLHPSPAHLTGELGSDQDSHSHPTTESSSVFLQSGWADPLWRDFLRGVGPVCPFGERRDGSRKDFLGVSGEIKTSVENEFPYCVVYRSR